MTTTHALDFDLIASDIGECGMQLTQLGAAEGAAGNISVFARALANLDGRFVEREELSLPLRVPALSGGWVVVTGSGQRLRDVTRQPEKALVVLHILASGERALRYSASEIQPTSELNSHLAEHADQVARLGVAYHALVHAQPFCLTYLSHHPGYATTPGLNHRLVRWQPETLVVFPEGIGMIPYQITGSAGLMEATVAGLTKHRLVVWQKHGVVARSHLSARHAADLVEYAETAARYEVENLHLGSPVGGLTDEQIQELCERFGVDASQFLNG